MPRMPRFARAAHFVEVLTLKMPANAVLPGSGSTRAGGKRRRDRCWSETVGEIGRESEGKRPEQRGRKQGESASKSWKNRVGFSSFLLRTHDSRCPSQIRIAAGAYIPLAAAAHRRTNTSAHSERPESTFHRLVPAMKTSSVPAV